MSLSISSKTNIDYLSPLPDDIKIKLISYFNMKTVSQITLINKYFNQFLEKPFIWFNIAEKFHIKVIKGEISYKNQLTNYFNTFYNSPTKISIRDLPIEYLLELRDDPTPYLDNLSEQTQKIIISQEKYDISTSMISLLTSLSAALSVYKSTKSIKELCLNVLEENLNNKEYAAFYQKMKASRQPHHKKAAFLMAQITAAILAITKI